MATTFHNIEAIIGQSFQIGYGDISYTFTVVQDENTSDIQLQCSGPINLGSYKLISSYTATEDSDLCNLKTLTTKTTALETAISDRITAMIAEITGGTTGGNVMLLPLDIEIGNITEATQEYTFGTLLMGKFIDRIIFEVLEPFGKADNSTIQFSIGTDESPELYVPKTGMESLQSTYVVNIYQTLTADTTFKLFVYYTAAEEEEDDTYDLTFVQRIDNPHDTVTASFTTDASGNVVNITLKGDAVVGNINDTELFGSYATGNYVDITVNIPLRTTGGSNYRIVQMNPALALYDGVDPNTSEVDGVWTKDKDYTIAEGETEFLYSFLVGETTGDDDYSHIYVYDLDADDPTAAFRSYHIKNELVYATDSATEESTEDTTTQDTTTEESGTESATTEEEISVTSEEAADTTSYTTDSGHMKVRILSF